MWRFWIDTGGTFTDCLAVTPEGERRRAKVLSSSSLRVKVEEALDATRIRVSMTWEVGDGFFAGYRLVSEEAESEVADWKAGERVLRLAEACGDLEEGDLCSIQSPEEPPVFAARLLTGTPLAEELPPMEMRLGTTRGTNALLEGKGAKVAFFVTRGFGDLLLIGNQQRGDLFALGIQKPDPLHARVCEVEERLDADGEVLTELDEEEARRLAAECREAGVESVAVALLHSYRNDRHEKRLAEILREEGFERVSVSSELSPMAKILRRSETALVDAYLAPVMDSYLDAVDARMQGGRLRVMTSAGGLAARGSYRPKDSLLSGPAGGVVGSSSVGHRAGYEKSIAFDMGGTSTDVSRFDGRLDYKFEQTIGPARVFAPSLRIETVAAGGGSICWFDGEALRVGPQSAGASPGPACYGAGGPLTLTDVNLLLERLDASRFNVPVQLEAAEERLDQLRSEIEESRGAKPEREELLQGWLKIADERMAEAIRSVSMREGYSPSDYALVAFGGAGGLHACSIADMLDMDTILFPADSGVLSAYGLQQARVERFEEKQALQRLEDCEKRLSGWVEKLAEAAVEFLQDDGEKPESIEVANRFCEMRFEGQDASLQIDYEDGSDLEKRFREAYGDQFGYVPDDLPVEVVSLRVSAVTQVEEEEDEAFAEEGEGDQAEGGQPVVERSELGDGDRLAGPLVVQDGFSTLFVAEGWEAQVGSRGTLKLGRRERRAESADQMDEVIELELFTNRFLALVDEMGALLERAAFSTNVKERRDFSCALLDREARLVANAPHIPVHLGAMGVCCRKILETMKLGPGDVVVTNHPAFGGSHLPDVTLLAAVYDDDEGELLGYVANRAHHAELGGIAPGSMPPAAKSLAEEGVVIPPTYLAREGEVDWDGVKSLLQEGPYPTRSLAENVADLSAQLASIRLGRKQLLALAKAEGANRVRFFMKGLRERAGRALGRALDELGEGTYQAEERLDGGAKICVKAEVKGERCAISFAGSADEQKSNYNATPAIVTSAVIYVLRLLARVDVPLNEGFLDVVDIEIPKGMLNPRFAEKPEDCPAVVAGNVEVSQRLVDTLVKAFGLAACSQGTMNNLIFGSESGSYYETIAGGEGAVKGRDGADAVHTHMTNTAITDAEILEQRFPVRLDQFSVRCDSGGKGRWRGGDGVTRRLRFLQAVSLSLLTQHRVERPFGLEGGEAGQRGRQWLERADGEKVELEGNASVEVEEGDVLVVETPGGGGWGRMG